MKATFIHKKDHAQLILFFNGWGMDENAIKHIRCDGFDLLMINEFNEKPFPIHLLQSYNKVYLVAWSLGVWMANRWLFDTPFICEKVIAINGTAQPIDAQFGIAPEIFTGTIDGWDSASRTRFELRMFTQRNLFSQFEATMPNRTVANQKEELQCLQTMILANTIPLQTWHKAIIGKNDRIFSMQNQLAYWQDKTNIHVTNMPHYPFCDIEHWNELLV